MKAFTPPEATTISELTGQHQVLNTSPTAGLPTNWWDMRHDLTVLPPSEDCTSCTVARSGKCPVLIVEHRDVGRSRQGLVVENVAVTADGIGRDRPLVLRCQVPRLPRVARHPGRA